MIAAVGELLGLAVVGFMDGQPIALSIDGRFDGLKRTLH
jgi:hypothetical protein